MEGSSRASMAPSGLAGGDGGGALPASAEFPAGLRVLVVDDDPICLKVLERMLCNCLYDVTTCSRAEVALSMLRERKRGFDLVLSDVYMPDMDGLKLLEHIGLEMDLPVIMMSSDGGQDVVMKGVKHGACDYLIKPVRMEALKNIWQHVIRKKRNEQSGVEDGDKQKRSLDDSDNASSANEGNCKNSKRRKEGKEEEDEIEEHEDSSSQKKPRVVWSVELHQEFVAAVKQLGVEKAVPKRILELMNVPGLTRENVASHLQKYRLYLRRLSGRQNQGRFDAPLTGATDSEFGSSSSLDGFDLQALGVSGHLPAQNLMNMHAGPRRVANTTSGMLAVDQIGFYNSDPQIANSSRVRYSSGQILDNKQMDLLWGPSINMEASQLGQSQHCQQALQAYGNMGLQVSNGTAGFPNLPSSLTNSSFPGDLTNGQGSNSYVMQMTQQGRHFSLSPQQLSGQWGHSLNGLGGEHHSTLPSTIGQQILPHEISGHISGRGGAILNRNALLAGTFVNTPSYSAVPRPQYDEFQNSCMTQPAGTGAGTCYPLVSSIGASGRTSTSMFQGAVPALSNTANLKGVNDFIPNYDLFSELRPSKSQDWKSSSKSQDWKLHNINLSCMSAQHLGPKQNNNDLGSSISTRQDFNATIKDSSSRNTCTSRKEIISLRAEIEQKIGCISQHNSTVRVENCVRVKDESMPNPSFRDVLADNIIPNELMSVFGRHQQEGLGQDESELNFDGCQQDDIPA